MQSILFFFFSSFFFPTLSLSFSLSFSLFFPYLAISKYAFDERKDGFVEQINAAVDGGADESLWLLPIVQHFVGYFVRHDATVIRRLKRGVVEEALLEP